MRAYGWDDLDLKIGHHPTKIGIRWTVSKEARFELLDRLLEENHRRYAAGEPVVTTPDGHLVPGPGRAGGPARARPARPVGRAGGGAAAGDLAGGAVHARAARAAAASRTSPPTTSAESDRSSSTGRWPRPTSGDDEEEEGAESRRHGPFGIDGGLSHRTGVQRADGRQPGHRGRLLGAVRAGASEVHESRARAGRGSRGTGCRPAGPVEVPFDAEGSDYLVPDPEQAGRDRPLHGAAPRDAAGRGAGAGERAAAAAARRRTWRGCTRWG